MKNSVQRLTHGTNLVCMIHIEFNIKLRTVNMITLRKKLGNAGNVIHMNFYIYTISFLCVFC